VRHDSEQLGEPLFGEPVRKNNVDWIGPIATYTARGENTCVSGS
jgi:hypothetical protein